MTEHKPVLLLTQNNQVPGQKTVKKLRSSTHFVPSCKYEGIIYNLIFSRA